MSIRPVIDSDMAALHRLVAGQKSKKKKKPSFIKPPIRMNKKPAYFNYSQYRTINTTSSSNFYNKPATKPTASLFINAYHSATRTTNTSTFLSSALLFSTRSLTRSRV